MPQTTDSVYNLHIKILYLKHLYNLFYDYILYKHVTLAYRQN